MERIFGDDSDYSQETRDQLKQVMQVSQQEQTEISIFGKTGMGKAEGIVVDAWLICRKSKREHILLCLSWKNRRHGGI